MNHSKLFLVLILFISALLLFYRVNELYPFIADQGWFYLSAKNLLAGHIPLVGITASYTWLHQGAYWTYLLAPVMLLFNYNPIGGVLFSAFLGIATVLAVYFVARSLFKSENIGLLSAFLFATSPLVIVYARMSYHTAPIPLFTLIFIYCIYKYTKGKDIYFPLATFVLGILYNFELATMILWIMTGIIYLFSWRFSIRIILLSIITFFIPLVPMIIYDVQAGSGFYQVTAFPRLIMLSIFNYSSFSINLYVDVLRDLLNYNQKLMFSLNKFVAGFIFIVSVVFLIFDLFKDNGRKIESNLLILILWIFTSLAGILFSKTASQAYLPMLYPGIIILVSYTLVRFWQANYVLKPFIIAIIILFSFSNVYMLLNSNYFTKNSGYVNINQKIESSKLIIKAARNEKYNVISGNSELNYRTNLDDYMYLILWQGGSVSTKKEKIKFIIDERDGGIELSKRVTN